MRYVITEMGVVVPLWIDARCKAVPESGVSRMSEARGIRAILVLFLQGPWFQLLKGEVVFCRILGLPFPFRRMVLVPWHA